MREMRNSPAFPRAVADWTEKGRRMARRPSEDCPRNATYQDLVMATPYRRGSWMITLVNRPELSSVV